MTTYPTESQPRILHRCLHRRILGGVAAGVANYTDLDVTTVRIIMVVLTLVGGVAVPLYLAAWLLIPEEGADASIAESVIDRAGLR
jgi:phage shock protein C